MLDEVRHRIPIHGVSRLIALAAVAVAAAAGPPSTAIAAASPLVATDGVVPSGPTSARVDGSADPEGSETVLRADYAPASAQWCVSGGADGAPLETVGEALGAGDVMYSEVSVGLEGLSPGVEYCAELVASSEAGTAHGGQRRFTTPQRAALAPLVATDGVVPSGPTSARVDGSADPEGSETVLRADYAPASAQWCVSGGAEGAPLETVGEALGAGDVMYSEALVGLEGLSPGVEYCAELVASSEAGTSRGGQRRFTTPHQATPPTADGGDPGALPEVTPLAPSGTPPSFGVAATVPSQARSPVAVARPAKAAGLARAPRACRHRPRKRRASCERRLRRRRAARGKRAGHTG